eukprot:3625840-Rhodomonas_salina.2
MKKTETKNKLTWDADAGAERQACRREGLAAYALYRSRCCGTSRNRVKDSVEDNVGGSIGCSIGGNIGGSIGGSIGGRVADLTGREPAPPTTAEVQDIHTQVYFCYHHTPRSVPEEARR